MNSVNSSLRAAKDSMMPAAFRRKLDSPAKSAKPAVVAKEESAPVIQAPSIAPLAPVAPSTVPDGKAAAPQRAPPRPADAAAAPQLNKYARAQLPKGEVIMSPTDLSASNCLCCPARTHTVNDSSSPACILSAVFQ